MPAHPQYLPILLTRRAECAALADLPTGARSSISPCFVVPPRPWDHIEMAPTGTVDEHVASIPSLLAGTWASIEPDRAATAFLDVGLLGDAATMSDGTAVLRWIIDETAAQGLRLVPVTSPGRSGASHDEVAALHRRDRSGACLRLTVGEWPSRWGPVALGRLLVRLGVTPHDVDLILDLGDATQLVPAPAHRRDLGRTGSRDAASMVVYELATLPVADQWRSVTVAGTSQAVRVDGALQWQRAEWSVHRFVRLADLPRSPWFGDHGMASADVRMEADLHLRPGAVHVTAGDTVLAIDAGRAHDIGIHALARSARSSLMRTGDWQPAHCELERTIEGSGLASIAEWRRLALHHHLVTVVEQLAALDRSVAGRMTG